MHNYALIKQFFLHFSKLVFFYNKQCKNYPFNYFLCFHIITIIIFIYYYYFYYTKK